MDNKAMFCLSYGLYVLTAKDGEKDNGCIINTAMQVTSSPNRISITVNKANYTTEIISRTGGFNLSMLTEETPFSVFQCFGFHSGRDTDKCAAIASRRAADGILYLTRYTNAFLSGRVVQSVDLGTHILFIADVTDGGVLGDAPSLTYAYYQAHIKPAPAPAQKGWRCRICGYVYPGDELPADFVCPICKHGAADFERIV